GYSGAWLTFACGRCGTTIAGRERRKCRISQGICDDRRRSRIPRDRRTVPGRMCATFSRHIHLHLIHLFPLKFKIIQPDDFCACDRRFL
ncbi:MAG: hypothetical protein ABUL48_01500, partial [Pseudorhodoplanes sp.]